MTGMLDSVEYALPWKTGIREVQYFRQNSTKALHNPVDLLLIARMKSCEEPLNRRSELYAREFT